MTTPEHTQQCKACGFTGKGKYCENCGQSYDTKRISVRGILHDILHYFTHLEKGFGYTLKQLIVSPGHMQRAYIQGQRSRHQKPFSMFLICATLTALSRYWIFTVLIKYYHADITAEATFFHEYMVLTYIALTPLYALLTYLLFAGARYNFAEIIVLMLYTLSLIFLAAGVISLPKLFFPHLETRFIEFPVFTLYMTLTMVHFFKTVPWWIVTIKCLLLMSAAFFLNDIVEKEIIRFIS